MYVKSLKKHSFPPSLSFIKVYESGSLHGIATFISHNGDREERCYVGGKLDGPAKYFYSSGSIETRIYENGVLQVLI